MHMPLRTHPRSNSHARRSIYRIIFDIQEDTRHVRVLRIWHGSRDAITAADVEE
jgi:mRNA-degrading endonuclease RelE of RelBE toxin-antitoxin system